MNAYAYINEAWKDKTDSKGNPYMWHIDMGLLWLEYVGADQRVKEAWCIHPLVQDYLADGYITQQDADDIIAYVNQKLRHTRFLQNS